MTQLLIERLDMENPQFQKAFRKPFMRMCGTHYEIDKAP